ncbi:MAG: 2-hydroxyacyl-CoA dehydratase family protein [Acidobacteriota bacterium]|jgi:benzoyl-CoA reductase/2-hydroxyglutaryl-CoA dehydratase subunit BcrC/BadD/HgdB|nr:2-hydroxyacyl-CoA dehydratase family protein [Acidobacteriota bacterium]
MNAQNQRETERLQKTGVRVQNEISRELEALRGRPDHMPGYDYFIDLLAGGIRPDVLEKRAGKPALNLLCVQAPLELIHAAGFLPFKIFSGSYAADALGADGRLPALTCPMLRAVRGIFRLNDSFSGRPWVLPTTCDWIVNLPRMLRMDNPQFAKWFHWLELPHLKDGDAARERWLAEVFGLKKFLEKTTGVKIDRKRLAASVAVYGRAWEALTRLEERRRAGAVPFVWFLIIANSFFLDAPEQWTNAVNALLPALRGNENKNRVFFAGSPVFFPNFKIPLLLEEAGLTVTGDDLCSSGRVFPGGINAEASSEYEMVAVLAGRYHEGCLCPTFADNDRRINSILGDAGNFEGVVFHVLKGCHPYDMESCLLEEPITRRGLKFLRLETDYTAEDGRNLLTRIEAFGQTL